MNTLRDNRSIVLASKSPRRKHLLEQAGILFSVVSSDVDEAAFAPTDPRAYVTALAEAKAGRVACRFPNSWVIGADTIVLIDGAVLGKPGSLDDARAMLSRLSGNRHHVLTGYAIRCKQGEKSFSDLSSTEVFFKKLHPDEIEWYIRTPEPYDKAGGYAIQGLGSRLVKSIRGSYTNVVGLPVCEVLDFFIRAKLLDLPRGTDADTDGAVWK